MQENTNRAIFQNTLILYIKMGITIVCGLLTTRFALKALGVTDFGLFSVLGGIISFIAIINTIQLSTSNRFIAVAIGKGDSNEINQQFNVNLTIHIAIAAVTALFAFPLGHWYIQHFINYSGPVRNALLVFYFTVSASIISFIGVPYNGLLMAKERFIVFSFLEVLSHIIKLVFVWLLVNHWGHKLLLYTVVTSILSCYQVPVYLMYCKKKWPEIVRPRLVKSKNKYKEVFAFSGWVAYGSIAVVAKTQGAALVINLFFDTIMNTALGLANTVNSFLLQFSHNATHPIAPQISKSYASGNTARTDELLILSTKVAYLLMFFVSIPFLVDSEWLLLIWLGEIPPYTSLFVKLIIIDGLISSFNSGISNVIFASGKIKAYQLSVNTIRLVSVLVAYFVLKLGVPPYYLYIVYIVFSLIVVITIQVVLNRTLNYDNKLLFRRSYLPSLAITALFVPYLFIQIDLHPIISILIGMIYYLVLVWIIGLSKYERERLLLYLTGRFRKK